MITKFYTNHENITFSLTVKSNGYLTVKGNGGTYYDAPWTDLFYKVILSVHDDETNWKARRVFYLPMPKWLSKNELRECALSVLMNEITFPSRIDDKVDLTEFNKSCDNLRNMIDNATERK